MEFIQTKRFYYPLHPRPVAVIISKCAEDRYNAMPASWITPVSEEPPTIAVAIDRESYTNLCLENYREATINIPVVAQADIVHQLGSISGREVDKISRYGIKLEKSKRVSVPIWIDAACFYEVRVYNAIDVGEVRLYIFEVLDHYCRKDLATEWGLDYTKTSLLLHGVGRNYYSIGRVYRARST